MGTIIGIYHRNARRVVANELEPMLAVSQTRARDGEDIWQKGAIALARQHFWLTPEEYDRTQPVFSVNQTIALVCSARIDNRRDLIQLLSLDNHEITMVSDADLILYAYKRWGLDCFEQLLGDFAVAIWDDEEQHLVLARDQLGAKGLCYYLTDDHIIAATEIGQVLSHPLVPRHLNEGKVAAFIGNFWDGSPETFYERISYCRPAEVVVVAAERVRRFTYWQPASRPIRYKCDDEYAEHFRELVKTAVSDRLRVVGPVGISLSGGLDSTMVAALAASVDANPSRLKTFSYVFDRYPECDEREYSRQVVEKYDLDASWLLADDLWPLRGYPDAWPGHTDYVMADAYAHLPLAVYDAAHTAGCRVVLNGHFGDILYSGERYWAASLLITGRFGQLWRALRSAPSFLEMAKLDLGRMGVLALAPQAVVRAFRSVRPYRQAWCDNFGLSPAFVQQTQLEERCQYFQQQLRSGTREMVARRLGLLHPSWSEGSPVAQSIYQARGVTMWMPLFDRRLVEFVLNIPADQAGRPGCSRRIGRHAMYGILPEPVRVRQSKTTFESLNAAGLKRESRAVVDKLLCDTQIEARGFVDSHWLRDRSIDYMLADAERRYRLWQWLSLEIWLRRYWGRYASPEPAGFKQTILA